MKDPNVFLAAPVRTPIGSFGGSLASLSAPQLGAHAAQACLKRSGLSPDQIDQVIMGHARQAGCGPNPARQVSHQIGIPVEKEAFTVNQACNSGLKAIMLSAQAIQNQESEIILAGGMESMSNTPYFLPRARWGMRLGHGEVVDGMYQDGFVCGLCKQVMGETAENLVDQFKISRKEQDEYAVRSQNRCEKAMAAGLFQSEMEPITLKKRTLDIDEHPRKGVSIASMAKLKPVFRTDGSVHPGNASGITDGAAAVMVLSEKSLQQVKQTDQTCAARIIDFVVAGVDPKVMGIGPVPAVQKLLEKTKVKLDQIDLIELNEAFAAQVIACDRQLQLDHEKLNVNGGAIALGHPIGATGARIVVTLLHEMHRRKSKLALATLCVSGGLGGAMLLERV